MPNKPESEDTPLDQADSGEVPLEELEERLEMQRVPAMDPLSCYADLCPEDCSTYCVGGYTGCPDKCGCHGSDCLSDCESLCLVDSCLVDIV